MVLANVAETRTLGTFILQRRKALKMTQSDFIQRLSKYPGVKSYADNIAVYWEKDKAMPPLDDPKFVKALADVLGVSESDILEAAGFSLEENAPGELPPDIEQMLRSATPAQRKKALAMLRLMLDAANDEAQQS